MVDLFIVPDSDGWSQAPRFAKVWGDGKMARGERHVERRLPKKSLTMRSLKEGMRMDPGLATMDGNDPGEFHVVEAQVRDAPALAHFWERLMDEESPPLFHAGVDGGRQAESAFRRMLAQSGSYRGYLLVPDSSGEERSSSPAGFILGSVYERLYGMPSRAGNIMHWYVVPEARGRRQGELLYRALLGWFRKEGTETVEVMARTEPSRTAAWRRRGFSEVLSLLVMPAPWKQEIGKDLLP